MENSLDFETPWPQKETTQRRPELAGHLVFLSRISFSWSWAVLDEAQTLYISELPTDCVVAGNRYETDMHPA